MFGATSDGSRRNDESEIKTEAINSTVNTDPSNDIGLTTSDQSQHELDDDLVFELLKESRRREALRYLHDSEGECTLGELAEHIAAKENRTDIARISSDQRKRVYVGLYQSHLPKLDECNVIDYDRSRGLIRLGSNADKLLSYIRFNPEKLSQTRTGILGKWIDKI